MQPSDMENETQLLRWTEPRRWRRARWKPYRSLTKCNKRFGKTGVIVAGILTAVISSLPFEPSTVGMLLLFLAALPALLLLDGVMFLISRSEIEFTQDGFSRKCGMLLERWKYEDVTDQWMERRTRDGQIVDVLAFVDRNNRKHEIALAEDLRPEVVRGFLNARLSGKHDELQAGLRPKLHATD